MKFYLILADCIRGPVGGDLGGLDHLLGRGGAAEPTAAPAVAATTAGGRRPPGASTPIPGHISRLIEEEEEEEATPLGAGRGEIIAETQGGDIQMLTRVRKEADKISVPPLPDILGLRKWQNQLGQGVVIASPYDV